MKPTPDLPPTDAATDDDMAEQARPGFGIPSQDPRPAAQELLQPDEAEREARSVLVGGTVLTGLAAGAGIGVAVAGPVGVVIGGTLGAVAGALGGAAASSMFNVGDTAGSAAGPDAAVRLHIDDHGGSGRPVVLIHGWPLSGRAWESQVPALRAAGFRVITYDRRGFGRSDKPESGYGYDVLADDLEHVMAECGAQDATLVGFSMGGGEVARYIARHGQARLRSVVFAAAVPPFLSKTDDNPDGPLAPEKAAAMEQALEQDREAFFDQFTTDFFSAGGVLQVSASQRNDAIALCRQSAQPAALACMVTFATTDFRDDLAKITVPTLVIHGDADAIVPIEGSGLRTHRAVAHSRLVRVAGAPHGMNVSHAAVFNDALLAFLCEPAAAGTVRAAA